jgi:hypothetical protein
MAEPPDYESPPQMPRWVKVFGIVLILVIVLVAIMLLTGGNHGPGRHFSLSLPGGQLAL